MCTQFPKLRSARISPPRGFTILEIGVAIGLLAVLMTSTVQMLRLASRQQRAMEQRTVALQTVQAVAELVGNIPWNELTPEAIDQLAIPESLKAYPPNMSLRVVMNEEAAPVAKRIHIELQPNDTAKQPQGTTRLTTWVFPK